MRLDCFSHSMTMEVWKPAWWKSAKIHRNEPSPMVIKSRGYARCSEILQNFSERQMLKGVLVLLKCWQFSSELTKTGSSSATECIVWIGNYNVKAWKTTGHKLHKIWRSLKFHQNFHQMVVYHAHWNCLVKLHFPWCLNFHFVHVQVKNAENSAKRVHPKLLFEFKLLLITIILIKKILL